MHSEISLVEARHGAQVLTVPRTWTDIAQHAFSVTATTYNSLPYDICTCPTLLTFI